MLRTIIFATLLVCPLFSWAKLFKNSYVSFELPDRWDCHVESTEWVCQSGVQKDSKEAIIILTAKEIGPSDTLEQYEAHLKAPRAVPGGKGQPVKSVVKHVQRRKIENHEWVDSLHLGSEIPSYYTRYLATVKQKLAILVTFSAHRLYFTKYSGDFFKAIQSLRVVATNDLFKPVNPLAQSPQPGTEVIGQPMGATLPGEGEDGPVEPEGPSSRKEKLFGLGLLLVAVGGYLLLKKRKN